MKKYNFSVQEATILRRGSEWINQQNTVAQLVKVGMESYIHAVVLPRVGVSSADRVVVDYDINGGTFTVKPVDAPKNSEAKEEAVAQDLEGQGGRPVQSDS